MKRKKLEKLGKGICPCCKGKVSIKDCSLFVKSHDDFRIPKPLYHKTTIAEMWPKVPVGFRWSCDACVIQKKAIAARPLLQNYNTQWDMPSLMYFDKGTTCKTCKGDFVFTKEEQQFWYEKLRFIIYSFPKECPKCRKHKRAMIAQNNRLMELTAIEDKTAVQLKELTEIYHEIGSEEKARMYANQLKKLKR